MKISFICPGRDNLKYFKWSYKSIVKNMGNHNVEICFADDFSNDGTWEWVTNKCKEDKNLKIYRNNGPERLGHTILYDKLINDIATNDICMIWHCDMYLCPGALDFIEKYIKEKTIVSLTRIEPPLHPSGPEKILLNGSVAAIEPEYFDEDAFLDIFYKDILPVNKNKITEGIFAPWAFYKKDFQQIGGHDILYAPQSKEDSDVFNRFQLNGIKFIQVWGGYVYHMTCRGSRFNPILTQVGKESNEWLVQNIKSTRNFIRKWGHLVMHDQYLKPIIPNKYNICFNIKNCTKQLINFLEPWCDKLNVDCNFEIIYDYCDSEQLNTKFNLRSKFIDTGDADIFVNIDIKNFSQQDMSYISQLSQIFDEQIEIGEFELGNLKIKVNRIKTYTENLIKIKTKYN